MNQTLNSVSAEINDQEKNASKFLTFFLGDEVYAVSVIKIREIIEYNYVTPIPKMPKFIRGAINLRGQIVPVIDLMERLDIGENTISNRSCIVIVSVNIGKESIIAGLVVDAVSQVHDFEITDIEDAPDFGGSIDTCFLEGMGKREDKFTVILNIDYILSMEDLHVLNEMVESGNGEEPVIGKLDQDGQAAEDNSFQFSEQDKTEDTARQLDDGLTDYGEHILNEQAFDEQESPIDSQIDGSETTGENINLGIAGEEESEQFNARSDEDDNQDINDPGESKA